MPVGELPRAVGCAATSTGTPSQCRANKVITAIPDPRLEEFRSYETVCVAYLAETD
jgi:hypothetical protein